MAVSASPIFNTSVDSEHKRLPFQIKSSINIVKKLTRSITFFIFHEFHSYSYTPLSLFVPAVFASF